MTYDPTSTSGMNTTGAASQIREHMEVVGNDGGHVGKVDHLKGDQIELAKIDIGSGGQHHYIPTSWVDRVADDKVYLSLSKDEAKDRWTKKD